MTRAQAKSVVEMSALLIARRLRNLVAYHVPADLAGESLQESLQMLQATEAKLQIGDVHFDTRQDWLNVWRAIKFVESAIAWGPEGLDYIPNAIAVLEQIEKRIETN